MSAGILREAEYFAAIGLKFTYERYAGEPLRDFTAQSCAEMRNWCIGTPADAISKLSAAMAKIAAMPDIKTRFGELGVEAASDTPDQFGAFIKSEIQKFAKLAKLAGVKPE